MRAVIRRMQLEHGLGKVIELIGPMPADWRCQHEVPFGSAGGCTSCRAETTLRAIDAPIDGEPIGELVETDEPGVKIDDGGTRWYSAAWL